MSPDDVDSLLESAVRDIGIPPRPLVLQQISDEMARAEPDPVRLGRVIGSDVSLSAGIMRLVNSPFFGLRAKPRTVQQALALLGMDVAARAATGIALRNAFPHDVALERFWDASARTAAISGWLADRLPLPEGLQAGDAYTFGLFRDCGIAVMMRRFAGYADTLRLANADSARSFTAVEAERHPTTHAVVGCLLARTWWLPEDSCLAIRHHHDIPAIAAGEVVLPARTAALIAVAQLAERALQRESGLSCTAEWQKLGPLCLGILGLDEAAAEQLLGSATGLAQDDAG